MGKLLLKLFGIIIINLSIFLTIGYLYGTRYGNLQISLLMFTIISIIPLSIIFYIKYLKYND